MSLFSKFFPSKKKPLDNAPLEQRVKAVCALKVFMENGEEVSLEQCSSEEFLLDSLLDRDVDVAYGCSNGVCGKCKAQLIEGTVVEEERIGLKKEDLAQGYILVCKSKPTSDLVISYAAARR